MSRPAWMDYQPHLYTERQEEQALPWCDVCDRAVMPSDTCVACGAPDLTLPLDARSERA